MTAVRASVSPSAILPASVPRLHERRQRRARVVGSATSSSTVRHRTTRSRVLQRGRVSAAAGQAAYEAIVAATADAQAGRIDAIATAPINKEAFAAAGLPWRGHTDLLAHLTGSPRVAMMFYAETLRVVLATVHIPLADVPRALTRDVMEGTIELAARETAALWDSSARDSPSPV